ncbi:MAG: T9SS type A sorting domain-containing protein [Saprospiraceae bacterium]|uniref:T9SS type A sorting domain-containing protein n=1 Tax=Candidatus Opimibacter skivensis TaxID=2982028 RepID=A0A9D7XQ77_9BACT|nr:T9SS type A sorting domain-containing protein [Candidatus Opimibacter skivensis]
MKTLKWLQLQGNNLTGEIPNEIGNLKELNRLELNVNQLSGEIPKEIGNLTNLTWLRLSQNRLQGRIPIELSNVNNLSRFFQLQNNLLTGCIPDSLFIHCDVESHSLSSNPGLPWGGDFERFCNGEDQIGAPCDDDSPNTINDIITSECECKGEINCNPSIVLDKVIIKRNKGSVLGSIELFLSGGNGNITVIWTNGSKGLKLINLLPGLYSCQVTDSIGCTIDFGPFRVGHIPFEDNSTPITIGDTLIHPLVGMPHNYLPLYDINERPEDANSTYSNEFLNEVSLYPNPTKDILNVTLSIDKVESIHISISNMIGSTLNYQNFIDHALTAHFDLSNLPAGVYFISIQTDRGRAIRKAIKT